MIRHLLVALYLTILTYPFGEPPSELAEINRVRLEQGKPALVWDDDLASIAQRHANIVANDRRGRLWHPGGGNEIAALGQTSIEEACSSWMNSRGHRAILLGNYTRVGVGSKMNRRGRMVWMAQFE